MKVDGWLLCDFRNRDYLAYRVLGLNFEKMSSRRWYYYIPARGTPKKARLGRGESTGSMSFPGTTHVYLSWKELHASLKKMLGTGEDDRDAVLRPRTTFRTCRWWTPGRSSS